MKNILITGAGGFIGKNLALILSKQKYQVLALTVKKQKEIKNIKWLQGRLDGNYQKHLKKVDLIIHCAASGVYKKEKEKKIYKVNFHDSLQFLKQAYKAGCKKWIILGTSGEYGYLKNEPMSVKKTKLRPINVYGKSKVLFFKKLTQLKLINECQILYLRIFHVYGIGEPKKRLYNGLIHAVKKNLNYKLTTGEEVRDFVSINFVVKKIINSFKLFNKKNFFLVKHIAKGNPIKVKNFARYHWKRNKAKKLLLFGASKKKIIYHTMYSDKKSLL